jgi:hypothetical protein
MVALAAAVKLLGARQGDAHQIAVMPVRVVRMPLEMGADGLNPRIRMLSQLKPVFRHFASVYYRKIAFIIAM